MSNEAHERGIRAAANAFWDHPACEDGKDAEAAIKAYLDASGLVLVPRDPTQAMLHSLCQPDNAGLAATYKAVYTSAPNPFESKQDA